MNDTFLFACPACGSPLARLSSDLYLCPADLATYRRKGGIWQFLPPGLEQAYHQFMQEYQAVRAAEGRGATDPAYYRDLPFRDRTGRFDSDWEIRARSFRALVRAVILPLEKQAGRALKILDLGAGNGWLSYRLARRGHSLAAIDLHTDPLDGLGAHVHYDAAFLPIQGDFNHLPFVENQADLAIFNASFHYSTDYGCSLSATLRALHPGGQVVILDTPFYHDGRSGAAMVREREALFQEKYGFASNALPSENFLTYRRLDELGEELGLSWRFASVFYGVAWAARRLRARFAGHREPAQFRLAVARRQPAGTA